MRRRRALFVSLAFLLCITASAAMAEDRPATKAPEPVRVPMAAAATRKPGGARSAGGPRQ